MYHVHSLSLGLSEPSYDTDVTLRMWTSCEGRENDEKGGG